MKKRPFLDRLSGVQKAFLLIVFLIPITLIEILDYFTHPSEYSTLIDKKVEIEIPKGATLTQIADTLDNQKILKDKDLFTFWAKSLGYEKKLRAGHYSVPLGLNDYQLVNFLMSARENTTPLTFLEGWDLEQFGTEIELKIGTPKDSFLAYCADNALIEKLGLQIPTLEGYLLPNTYYFSKNESATDIIKYLVQKTLDIFEIDSVVNAMQNQRLTQHEILTLASIVEGEAIIDEERPIIASLYYNRLKKRMRLQADPTIQYIIDGPPRRLLNRDLEIDSPYNTYLNYGLPPGPINNPGKASILAAIFPSETDFIYMVASGNGKHTFTKSLTEHLKAKASFDKIRREVARERRRKGN